MPKYHHCVHPRAQMVIVQVFVNPGLLLQVSPGIPVFRYIILGGKIAEDRGTMGKQSFFHDEKESVQSKQKRENTVGKTKMICCMIMIAKILAKC